MSKHAGLTRRGFIKSAAASMGAFSMMNVFPSSVLGANDRISFGVIGVGGMGTGHLNHLVENRESDNTTIAAVCDVYRRRVNKAMQTSGAEGYMDYREVLDRKDIDAVLIATPDHWHSKIAIEAMESGKHVYCEKPMTHTVEQALELREAVKRTGMLLQVGPNDTSRDSYWKAHDIISQNRVGKVTWAQGSYNRNVRNGAFNKWFLIDEAASPYAKGDDYVNWDMWLGHKWDLTPKIPWNPEHFFRFRKYFEYNGGVATDLLYHILAPLLVAITGPDGEYPYRVNANGGLYILKDGRDIPDVFTMTVDYKSEFTVNLTSILTNNTQQPTRICGQYGTIEFQGGKPVLTGNGDFLDEFKQHNNGYSQVTVPTEDPISNPHRALEVNLMDAIRKGERLFCNVDLGTATMIAIKMGVESYRQNKTMIWNAGKERIES